MTLLDLAILAVGLSADAFAASVCKGLSAGRASRRTALAAGLWFGGAQALMPLAGYLLGAGFSRYAAEFAEKTAFVLLCFIGGNMLLEALRSGDEALPSGTSPAAMVPLAAATSIDALAVGVSFALLGEDILRASLFIGTVTFILSAAGVLLGAFFGSRWRRPARAAGGLLLIFLAFRIIL